MSINKFQKLYKSLLAIAIFLTNTNIALADYNPNYIIRDDLFTNKNTMTASDIQTFLSQKGSCLASIDPSLLGGDGKTAAQIIYEASQNAYNGYGINPQVLITTLQKEWSLISSSCATLNSLYGGMSGGPNIYAKRALGYNVPDVLGIGDCLYTFYGQMRGNTCNSDHYMGGPDSMRYAYNANKVGPGGNYAFPNSFVVQQYSDRSGNVTINPGSKATSVLFRYTPYAYYGNYNFYNIFRSYFGDPTSGSMDLVKGSGSTIYAIKNGVRYPVSSTDALVAWGLQYQPVNNLDDATLSTYPLGSVLSRVFKEIDGPRVFVVQGGARKHIRTSLYTVQLGLENEPVGELPSSLVGLLPTGAPLGFLFKSETSPDIYLGQVGRKIYVPDVDTIMAWGFSLDELTTVSPYYTDSLENGGNLSILTKGSTPEMYVASNHQFMYIPSLQRVRDWKMENYWVTILDDQFLESLPHVGIFSQVTQGSGAPIYYINAGKRYHLSSLTSANKYNRLYGPLINMADNLISRVPYAGAL